MEIRLKENYSWQSTDVLVEEAIKKEVFPGAVLLVAHHGRIVKLGAYGFSNLEPRAVPTSESTVYDLASLTKPLATTIATMHLVSERKLDLDHSLVLVFPSSRHRVPANKRTITVRHLLSHSSGYPAYRPYYQVLEKELPQKRKERLRKLLLEEELEAKPGKETCYSDLGFLMLQEVVEEVSGNNLEDLVKAYTYNPLRLHSFTFSPGQKKSRTDENKPWAATEYCPWRGKRLAGEVHDENAHVLGGVAGHAGLFGCASDIFVLLRMLYDIYSGAKTFSGMDKETVRTFWKRQKITQNSTWALGFDTPRKDSVSSAGKYFSDRTVGHLGFTGTSFWFDLETETLVILLTNRVYFGRENEKIREFRPLLHDSVVKALMRVK